MMDSFVSPLVTLFAYEVFNVSIVAFQSEKPQEAIDVIYHGLAVYTCSPFLLGGICYGRDVNANVLRTTEPSVWCYIH